MSDKRNDSPTSWRASKAIRAAILSPGVLIFISGVRLLIIGNYDPTTASSVASSSGLLGTLLGTLIPIIPSLLPALALVFIVLRKPLLLALTVTGTLLVSPAYASVITALRVTGYQFSSVYHILHISNLKIQHHLLWVRWADDRPAIIFGGVAVLIITIDNWNVLLAEFTGSESDPGNSDEKGWQVGYVFFLTVIAVVIDIAAATTFFLVTTIYHIPYTARTVSSIASKPWLPSELITLKSGTTSV